MQLLQPALYCCMTIERRKDGAINLLGTLSPASVTFYRYSIYLQLFYRISSSHSDRPPLRIFHNFELPKNCTFFVIFGHFFFQVDVDGSNFCSRTGLEMILEENAPHAGILDCCDFGKKLKKKISNFFSHSCKISKKKISKKKSKMKIFDEIFNFFQISQKCC